MADLGMLVDNADVRARDGATFERRNPVTGLRWITIEDPGQHYPF